MSEPELPRTGDDLGDENAELIARSEIPSLPVDLFEGYHLTQRIAEGGMGAVFRGRQLSLDRTVAIKVLKPRLAKDKSFLRRFEREARAVARLNHRHVVGAIDVGTSRGWHYLVMEYVDGPTLSQLLEERGQLPERDAIRITWQVCSALSHAHKHGLVHRDIKPENVILASNGDAKLCDLGLAKDMRRQGTMLTVVGTAMGTPLYISPEQARGAADIDIRSDIYSLGATFYHMVCGRPPFEGTSAAVLMAKHLTEEPTPVQMRNPEASEGAAHVIETMLAKDPEARYQTPGDVRADLRLVAAGKWRPAGAPEAAPIPTSPHSETASDGDQPKYEIRPKKAGSRLRRRRRRR